MIKKLFFVAFILIGIVLYAQTPKLENFRIENNEPSRVYFDVKNGDISTLTKQGFIISGKTISSINTTDNYFTVSSAFTFWDNNTIRLENGSGLVNDFTLTYIENKITEPTSSLFRFVSASASGSGDGLSEVTAWTFTQAIKRAKPGMTIWIKAGNYMNQFISKPIGGRDSSPIKFIGYMSIPGDIESIYYKYGEGELDPTQMPLFDGMDRTRGTFYNLKNKNYNIWKNIQFTGYSRIFRSASIDGFVGDNILIKDIGHGSSNGDSGASSKNGNGNGFVFQSNKNNANKIRLSNCVVINATKHAYQAEGNHNLYLNCKAYCDEVDLSNLGGMTTDYYFIVDGSNNIIKNSFAFRNTLNGKGHNGHAIAIKSSNHLHAEYNLVDNNTVINCGWGIQARWMGANYNVFKNNLSHSDVVNRSSGNSQVAYIIKDGADYNIFENNIIKDIDDGFWFEYGKEDPTATHAGSHNIIRNNEIYNLDDDIISFMGGVNTGNKIYNNTVYKISGSTFTGSGTYSGCEFKNNILHSVAKSNSYTGWAVDTNTFYNSTPIGSNRIVDDPKFEDAENGNFKLTKIEENKSINSGKKLPEVSSDFNGNSRYEDEGPDIGAHEYKGNSTSSIKADAGQDVLICKGESTTLTASGGSSYLWSTGETTSVIIVSPTDTSTYSVTVTEGIDSDTDEVTVTVNQPPTVDVGLDQTICEGESVTLTATGNGDFLWSTGEITASIIVDPTATTTYTVTASNSCSTDATDELIVNVTPGVTLDAGSDVSICSGENVTLLATGTGPFNWSTGETTASITVNPTSTTTYSITSTNGSCSQTDDVTVTVNTPSTINAGSDQIICEGESVMLTATGNGDFLWSTGETTASIIVDPKATTTYTVTASNSCSSDAQDQVTITVNETPIVVVSDDVSLENGSSTVLVAIGEGNFLWSTGETTSSITVSPTTTTTYNVTLTSDQGCSDQADIMVTVLDSQGSSDGNSSSGVSINASPDQNICLNEIVTLTATGGNNYLWNTGETTDSINVSPDETTVYAVTISNGNSVDVFEITIAVDKNCSGTSNRLSERESKFYPNPTRGDLNIELAGYHNDSVITVFDINGRMVYNEDIDNYTPIKILKRQLNLLKYGKGIYFVRITNNNTSETKKILVI